MVEFTMKEKYSILDIVKYKEGVFIRIRGFGGKTFFKLTPKRAERLAKALAEIDWSK